MNLLLDTHMLIWAAVGTLPRKAEQLLVDANNTLYFSPASLWEIGIKQSLGRNDFAVDAAMLRRGLVDAHYIELPITAQHTLAVNDLPALHKDPFDRILLAQAKCEGFWLLTSDKQIKEYPGSVLFIGRGDAAWRPQK
ncbi:type II toxin-antitoxin system VapC family toxin [Desulfovibrio cuneatus]|uniref:type II toxin-antitoxin system VapC family toxin n=1 Tax=Desulfovibrio cuneatus TaxID=159728 RepID=UPI0004192BC8|nr:type II toxin-antitoxin system VapC family toxin [Desulfovibrio cuneatus]